MRFISTYALDKGQQKHPNQDALVLAHAQCGQDDQAVFAMICDGVGGLTHGELASAIVTKAFRDWFLQRGPALCTEPEPQGLIFAEWQQLLLQLHEAMLRLSAEQGFRLGTTAEVLLLLHGRYYICHVGDCRIYHLAEPILQLTVDHTIVQREMDAGRLSPEQARHDKRRSLLWQCVGAGKRLQPDLIAGDIEPGQGFLLCCDGLHRRMPVQDMRRLGLGANIKHHKLPQLLPKAIDICRRRGETDNITGILICEHKPTLLQSLLQKQGEAAQGGFRLTKDVFIEHSQPQEADE